MEFALLRRLACFVFPLVLVMVARGDGELGSWVVKDGGGEVTGVDFRVWSPNAVSVAVAGDFNGWSTTADVLTVNAATKIWSGTVAAARPGDAYKYVITTGDGAELWRKDPRAREVMSMDDGSLAGVVYDTGAFVWEDGGFEPEFPNKIVMYEMHVGTFYDPRPEDGEPATFYDAVQRLDYLQALGVNMIALMPVSEFNGRHSWGYNPIALFAIEQAYGGPDGLKHFVNEAHKRGMAVQVDVVHNHYGDLAAPGASDLENFDGGEPYFYNAEDDATRPGISRTKWGPRPRYVDANVQEFIKDNVRMYLDEYKIWALRWDSPRNITGYDSNPGADVGDPDTDIPEAITMMEEINAEIRDRNVRYYSVAEDADSAGGYSGHWEISFHNVLFPRLLPLTGNGTLPEPFEGRLTYPTLDTREGDNIGYRLEVKQQPGFRVIFSENHDKCGDLNSETDGARLAQDFDPADPTSYAARKKSMLASAVTLSSAGTPMLFQGQEQLADGFFDAYVRLDWLRAGNFPGMVRFHRDMIRLRRNLDGASDALTYTSFPNVDDLTGVTSVNLVNEEEGWMSYVRTTGEAGGAVVVAVNFSEVERTVGVDFPEAGDWNVLLNSDARIYGDDFGDTGPAMGSAITTFGENNYQSFQVAPWSVVVFGKSTPAVPVADGDGDGIDDGWEMLFGVDDPTADGDGDGFDDLSEYVNGTDPTVADFAALPGTFNNWNIESPVLRWDGTRGLWRHVSRFLRAGQQECKAYLADGWVAGDNHVFQVAEAGAVYEITYDPASGEYGTTRVDDDADADGMADAWEAFWFYPAVGAEPTADADGDGFTNLEEFQRASDPTEADQPAMGVVGGHNGWNWGARNMRYAGHGVWVGAIAFVETPGDRAYKFGVGPGPDDANWGVPQEGNASGFKSSVDFQWPAGVQGWRFISFNEKTFATSVGTFEGAADSDGDGMPDDWEVAYGLNPAVADGSGDADGDSVGNLLEYQRLSNPQDAGDHYAAMHMPGSGYWGWGEGAASNAMVWNPAIARWEFVFRAAGAFEFEFKFVAADYNIGTWGWVDGVGVEGQAVPWANGNISDAVADSGWWVVRFEEISGAYEIAALNPTDSDADGMPDEWERFHGLDPAVADVSGDLDGDRVRDVLEFERLSDPRVVDYSSVMHMPRTGDWEPDSPRNALVWDSANGLWEGVLFLPRSGAELEFKFAAGNYSVGK
jgi:1,4-alpha-glucan branching enzyme